MNLWPPASCPFDEARSMLTDPPDNRLWCEGAARLVRVHVNQATFVGTIEQILLSDFCSAALSHHVGDLVWAQDGSMYLSSGDGASFVGTDVGVRQDNCYVDDGPLLQGAFRSQHDEFLHGKVLRIYPEALLVNRLLERDVDYTIIAKGLRNPFRISVDPVTFDVWVCDVGSDFAEEVNVIPNPLAQPAGAAIPNFGWPCFEGIYRLI